MEKSLRIGIQEKPKSVLNWVILSLQHVFAMFGATVLVPLLVNFNAGTVVLSTGVTLIASGVGTLIYIACTKGKVPVYLGSSFAYIGAMSVAGAVARESVFFGLMLVGIIYAIVATVIRYTGNGWIKKLLPPVVIGPVIITIGLGLAPTAIEQSGLMGVQSLLDVGMYGGAANPISGIAWKIPLIAVVTFGTVIGVALKGKGFFRIIPFICAIAVGYVLSVVLGVVDYSGFSTAKFIQDPGFYFLGTYAFNFNAVLIFAPIAFVTIAEHIGDHTVLGEITGKDFIEDPGLENTIMGDGIATFVSAAIGGPANTTYGENTGVVAMTRVGSVWVVGLAAIFAIVLGLFGYISAFINSIPWAIIGGMTIILYGLIAGNGVKVLINHKVNLTSMRNLIIVATILVIGLGGAAIQLNEAFAMSGMSLAAIVGIVLNLVLPKEETE